MRQRVAGRHQRRAARDQPAVRAAHGRVAGDGAAVGGPARRHVADRQAAVARVGQRDVARRRQRRAVEPERQRHPAAPAQRVARVEVVVEVGQVDAVGAQRAAHAAAPRGDRVEAQARRADRRPAAVHVDAGHAAAERHDHVVEGQAVDRARRDARAARDRRVARRAGHVYVRVDAGVGIAQRQAELVRQRGGVGAAHLGRDVEPRRAGGQAGDVAAGDAGGAAVGDPRVVDARVAGAVRARGDRVERGAAVAAAGERDAGLRLRALLRAADGRDAGELAGRHGHARAAQRAGVDAARAQAHRAAVAEAAVRNDVPTGGVEPRGLYVDRAAAQRHGGRGAAQRHAVDPRVAEARVVDLQGGVLAVGQDADRRVDAAARGRAAQQRREALEAGPHAPLQREETARVGAVGAQLGQRAAHGEIAHGQVAAVAGQRRVGVADRIAAEPGVAQVHLARRVGQLRAAHLADEVGVERARHRRQRGGRQAGQRGARGRQQREPARRDDAVDVVVAAVECDVRVERGAVAAREAHRADRAVAVGIEVERRVERAGRAAAGQVAARGELGVGAGEPDDRVQPRVRHERAGVRERVGRAVDGGNQVGRDVLAEHQRAVRAQPQPAVARADPADLEVLAGERDRAGRIIEDIAAVAQLRRGERAAHERPVQRPVDPQRETEVARQRLARRGGGDGAQPGQRPAAGQHEAQPGLGEVVDAADQVQRHASQGGVDAGRVEAVVVGAQRAVHVADRGAELRREELAVDQLGARADVRVGRAVGADEAVDPGVEPAQPAVDQVHRVGRDREVDQRPDRQLGRVPVLRREAARVVKARPAGDRVAPGAVLQVGVEAVVGRVGRREHGVGADARQRLDPLVVGHHETVDQRDRAVAHPQPHVDRGRVGPGRRAARAGERDVVGAVGVVDQGQRGPLEIDRAQAEARLRARQQVAQREAHVQAVRAEDGLAGLVADHRGDDRERVAAEAQARLAQIVAQRRDRAVDAEGSERVVSRHADPDEDHEDDGDDDQRAAVRHVHVSFPTGRAFAPPKTVPQIWGYRPRM